MRKLYAQHKDGRKLYLPQWDMDGEIMPTNLPTAAVTIDQDGTTFPEGSTWIRRPRSSGLLDGWKLAKDEKPTKRTRAPNASYLTRLSAKAGI